MILKDLQICKSPKNFLLVPDKTQKQQAWNILCKLQPEAHVLLSMSSSQSCDNLLKLVLSWCGFPAV